MSTTIPLNACQDNAFSEFLRFMFSEETELNLSGAGGTGKTYTMGAMIHDALPKYKAACQMLGIEPKYTSVVMTATTNKAAEELSRATGTKCTTIHTFLRLVMKPNYSSGERDLTRTVGWSEVENFVIFIDESSMISKALLREIRAACANSKVVFIGDHCQLAPVKESISPVYTSNNKTVHLETQERAKNHPELVSLFRQLRANVEMNDYQPIQLYPGIIEHISVEDFQAELETRFANHSYQARILAFTNKQVDGYNAFIREVRNLPPTFTVGEYVVNPDVTKVANATLHSDQEFIIKAIQSDVLVKDLPDNGKFEYILYQLESRYGEIIDKVPVPVDPFHRKDLISYYTGYGKRTKDWSSKFWLDDNVAGLRQRDASTIHKAQGITTDTVYVDLNDLGICKNPADVSRLLYVAASRAANRVVFVGNLPSKYNLRFLP